MSETYEIKLPQFEGPFDLLLFFIERDELDIYDIPIAKITDDFLAYLHQMDQMDIELASEFILVAATLMRIKARVLLPRKELDEEGNEVDPREELVQKLLEYKRFKAVLQDLQELEAERSHKFGRGNVNKDLKQLAREQSSGEAELQNLTTYKLMKAFARVLERFEDRTRKVEHEVIRYNYTINGQKEYLLKTLSAKKETNFAVIFETCENRIHAIFNFLALLEMVQLRQAKIKLGKGANNFWIKLTPETAKV